MIERPPMTATASHPTKSDYPQNRMVLSSFYIQSFHPANQITCFLHQHLSLPTPAAPASPGNRSRLLDPSMNDAQSPDSSQYKSSSENRSNSRASSAASFATSILWYNDVG